MRRRSPTQDRRDDRVAAVPGIDVERDLHDPHVPYAGRDGHRRVGQVLEAGELRVLVVNGLELLPLQRRTKL